MDPNPYNQFNQPQNYPPNPLPGNQPPAQMPQNYQNPYAATQQPQGYGAPQSQVYGPPTAPFGPPQPALPPQNYGQIGYGTQPPQFPNQAYSQPNNYNSYSPAAYVDGSKKAKSGSGKKIAVSMVILLLIVAAVTIFIVAGGGSNQSAVAPKKSTQQAADPALADVASRPDGVLDLSKKIDGSTSVKAQSVQAKVNEQVNLTGVILTKLDGDEIKPGDQIEARLVYEVEAAEAEWALVHKETYQKTTDNTTFTVEGRVAVSLKPETQPSATAPTTPPTTPTPQ